MRYVVLIQGIDSSSACGGPMDGFSPRREAVLGEIRPLGIPETNVLGLSYSGTYYDPATCSPIPVEDVAASSGLPLYNQADTCGGGVTVAASQLEGLLYSITEDHPNATFSIVGHSMGGVVAAYFAATTDWALLDRVHSIILLDSPVQGVPMVNQFTSACDPDFSFSWQDMLPGSAVISIIGTEACARFDAFYAVASTPIGQGLPCAPVNYAQGYTAGSGGAIVGGAVGTVGCASFAAVLIPVCLFVGIFGGSYVLDQLPAHSAAWRDPWALDIIANAVRAPEAQPSSAPVCDTIHATIEAGQYQDFEVLAGAGQPVSVSVAIERGTSVDIRFVAYAPDSSVVLSGGRLVSGSFDFPAPLDGRYTLRLDNTYSLFTPKFVRLDWCIG